jgi:hypothetical protein
VALLSPTKHWEYRISTQKKTKIEVASRHVCWEQEKLFDDKTKDEKSCGIVTLTKAKHIS